MTPRRERRQRVKHNRVRRRLHRFARRCGMLYPQRNPSKKVWPRWDELHPRPVFRQWPKYPFVYTNEDWMRHNAAMRDPDYQAWVREQVLGA